MEKELFTEEERSLVVKLKRLRKKHKMAHSELHKTQNEQDNKTDSSGSKDRLLTMMAPGRREAFLELRERLSNGKPELNLDKDDPDEKVNIKLLF
ncbi:hypothetical protein LSH36_399g05026 [Paralvinella palmiformis]|uniref:Uncharacterized protein n=1 Tax=Paralvinella palmiformis TaxID=53620 RepID=A0AAD9JD97_9ANNE|nr:hypothetical protein LSH36_399g05026 [Paralvinella palmiformis]